MARASLFTGRSGQLAVMAGFLIRELNVAIPEVDIGDDIVVVRDDNDEVTRVQVKTANAVQQAKSFYAQYRIPLKQIEAGPAHLVYAFVVRRRDRWEEFVMVRRSVLQSLWTEFSVGSEDGHGNLILRLRFTADEIRCKGLNFQAFRSRFSPWPPPAEMPGGVMIDRDA